MIGYLLFPRRVPMFSFGKIAFFLFGSWLAWLTTSQTRGPATWLLVFAFYELILSQGKYLLNDLAGRASDYHFLRAGCNRAPAGRRGLLLIGLYAGARAGLGIGGLLLVAGWFAALLGLVTLLLQVLYELDKLWPIPHRGACSFAIVSANYGVRALAGLAAVATSIALLPAALTFLWATSAGALFLSIYWQRQGELYLEQHGLAPEIIGRFKPGVLAVYRCHSRAAKSAGRPLPQRLLLLTAAGAACFVWLDSAPSFAERDVGTVLILAGAGLVTACLRRTSPLDGPTRALLSMALGVVSSALVLFSLLLHTAAALPSALLCIAPLVYLVLTSEPARTILGAELTTSGTTAA